MSTRTSHTAATALSGAIRVGAVVFGAVLGTSLLACEQAEQADERPGTRRLSGPAVELEAKKAEGDPVAKIGEVTLTVGDLQGRLDQQSPFVRARYQTDEKKKEFLDNQVRFELLALEAQRRGLHKDPDVQETLKKVMVQKLTRLDFEGKVKLSDITDEEMKAYYDSHQDEYNKPEMVRSSVIKVSFGTDAKSKADAKAKAERAHKSASAADKLEDRNHFRRLVTEFSDDEESKKVGGDVRYLSQQEYTETFGPEAADAVWKVQAVNGVTPVIEGKDAFYVFKKTGKRKPITRDFESVKNQIRNLLYRDKRTAAFDSFVDQLEKSFGVTKYEENLSKLQIKGPAPGEGDGTLQAPHEGMDLPEEGMHP